MTARDAAVFASWRGRHADSPRAVAEELRRRGAPVEPVWILADGARGHDGARAVPPGSAQEREELERARYVVSNDLLPMPFRKAPGATYLQTWHGTPLKRIAYDVERPAFPGSEHHYAVELARDIARWDLLVSPNRFSTDVLRRAFRYEGEIVETGYPRNDVLLSPERDAIRARVRAALGVKDGVRAVLYAPTWRDGDPFELELDLDAMGRELGEGHVVLVRAHSLVAHTARLKAATGVRDVTAHPDISDLYLAADVLLTDYSSAMFDFAVTRKPILFFTYDLECYRDRVRGFYLDFEAEAPGPLLSTTGEVIAALHDLDEVVARHAGAYERFHERFCHLEDGHAAERVVDALLRAWFAGA